LGSLPLISCDRCAAWSQFRDEVSHFSPDWQGGDRERRQAATADGSRWYWKSILQISVVQSRRVQD
jgi:hypothetical protein